MSNPRDKSSRDANSPDTSRPDESLPDAPGRATADAPAANPPTDSKRSGRIAYDERGNSVWEWQLETGVYSRDISTQRLKKLDLNDLSIADTGIQQRPPGLTDPASKAMPGGGFNPYDNSSTRGGKVGTDPYNSAGRSALKSDPWRDRNAGQGPGKSPPARKPTDLRKLQEWMELRKRVEQNKREDDDD